MSIHTRGPVVGNFLIRVQIYGNLSPPEGGCRVLHRMKDSEPEIHPYPKTFVPAFLESGVDSKVHQEKDFVEIIS
jgi:hypothetical protein